MDQNELGRLLHDTIEEYESFDDKRMKVQESQAEVITRATDRGLDKSVLKKLIRERRRDVAVMKAERDMLTEYRDALDLFEATPLGAYAKGKAGPTDGASQLKELRAKDAEDPHKPSDEVLAEMKARDEATDTSINGMPDDEEEPEIKSLANGNGGVERVLRKKRATKADLDAERLKEGRHLPPPQFDA